MRDTDSFTSHDAFDRYKTRREDTREAAQALIRLLTTQMGDERDGARDGLAEALMHEHPTHRQSALKVLRDSCQEIREMPVDLRSEGSQKLIQLIADFDEPMPYV